MTEPVKLRRLGVRMMGTFVDRDFQLVDLETGDRIAGVCSVQVYLRARELPKVVVEFEAFDDHGIEVKIDTSAKPPERP